MTSPRSAARSLAGGDEAIWKRLQEAGFDEESVRRRDKAALIAYITKLESQLHDYQHHMGLLILEKKELSSTYDQVKASSESAEFSYKRDLAAKSTALAEARKREESLKKALAIEKECVANIDKALHDMRAVSAETKVSYESKLVEAHAMVESAQKKFDEAERKLHEAESLHAEANRFNETASRSLQDAKAREDDLRRRLISFESECETKENDIRIQRQSLHDSQKVLRQEQERLLEGQSLLNQREEYILEKSKELSQFEKEIDEIKVKLEDERRDLKEEKSNFELDKAALVNREETVLRRECYLDKKEREVLVLQEKIASKELDEIQRLKDENQHVLDKKLKELEAEAELRRFSAEEEITQRIMSCGVKESDLIHRENLIRERELALDSQQSSLVEKQDDLSKLSKMLDEKEQNLLSTQKSVEIEMLKLQKERDEIQTMKIDMEKMMGFLEDKKNDILKAQQNLEITQCERNELHLLEARLKEEIDSFRAQKKELASEADKLKADMEQFEIEWELVDEKREELRKEAERVTEERKAASKYLKDERDSIKLEKDNLRNQFKRDVESLSHEREEFMSKMEREHSDWFNKIQQEREDFARDIMIQRKELENCIDKRREEIETYQREKEKAFEQQMAIELETINSQKEKIAKDLEHVGSEFKRLNDERTEIALDREKRERDWAEIKSSIESLDIQRQKLQKQRELLHADREEIFKQIQHLEKLEDLNIESENMALSQIQTRSFNSSIWKVPIKRCPVVTVAADSINDKEKIVAAGGITPKLLSKTPNSESPPASGTISWIRKVIFRRSPEKADISGEGKLESQIMASIRDVSVANGVKSRVESTGIEGHKRTVRKEMADEWLQEDKSENIYRFTDGDVSLLPSGKKRLNNMLSNADVDNMLEPARKHHRATKQNGTTDVKEAKQNGTTDVQEANSNCRTASNRATKEDLAPPLDKPGLLFENTGHKARYRKQAQEATQGRELAHTADEESEPEPDEPDPGASDGDADIPS